MGFIRSFALLCVIAFSQILLAAAPRPDVDLRASLRPSPVRLARELFVEISGTTSRPDGSQILVEVTRSTGGSSALQLVANSGKFKCRYPVDFPGAPKMSPSFLYVSARSGNDLFENQSEILFIITGSDSTTRPDFPSAFTDDFIDQNGGKDSNAVSWRSNRELVNLFMKSRAAKLAKVGQPDFDLDRPVDFARFKQMATLYDFEHRDRNWSEPSKNRVARTFWQAEWNRWFGAGNSHPWDGNPANRSRENYRPYTFTNDLADLYILHQMRRDLPRISNDNRDAMSEESLANLIGSQHRETSNFALPENGKQSENYTAGAFRYGLFETGEWLEEGKGWFVSPKSGDHRGGGVFIGRSVWALGESLKRDPQGIHAKHAAEALALAAKFSLHDGLKHRYTKKVGANLPLWRQAGEHGYLTLGFLAAAETLPDLPMKIDPALPAKTLMQVTVEALNALVASVNEDGYWTKYPDQDAMAVAALAEAALIFPNHPDAGNWKRTAIRAADGWISAKQDPSERLSACSHFGRRDGTKMTYYIGDQPEVHINLYISGLWLHALSKMYHLTGSDRYKTRAEGMISYLCGDNPFHARLLNELGAVFNIIRDTDDERSRLSWDCYPESTAFVQIGLLHWLDALQFNLSKPKS